MKMRHWIKPLATLMLIGMLSTPANARVFTTPGWYIVHFDYDDDEWTEEGPFKSEDYCRDYGEWLAEEDEDFYLEDHDCVYLSQAMSNDT